MLSSLLTSPLTTAEGGIDSGRQSAVGSRRSFRCPSSQPLGFCDRSGPEQCTEISFLKKADGFLVRCDRRRWDSIWKNAIRRSEEDVSFSVSKSLFLLFFFFCVRLVGQQEQDIVLEEQVMINPVLDQKSGTLYVGVGYEQSETAMSRLIIQKSIDFLRHVSCRQWHTYNCTIFYYTDPMYLTENKHVEVAQSSTIWICI
jgi:hypothetical protein